MPIHMKKYNVPTYITLKLEKQGRSGNKYLQNIDSESIDKSGSACIIRKVYNVCVEHTNVCGRVR